MTTETTATQLNRLLAEEKCLGDALDDRTTPVCVSLDAIRVRTHRRDSCLEIQKVAPHP
jgi:hypothetical protein